MKYATMKVHEDVHKKFMNLCDAEGRKVSSMIDFLVRHWESSHNDGLLRVYSEIKKSKEEK